LVTGDTVVDTGSQVTLIRHAEALLTGMEMGTTSVPLSSVLAVGTPGAALVASLVVTKGFVTIGGVTASLAGALVVPALPWSTLLGTDLIGPGGTCPVDVSMTQGTVTAAGGSPIPIASESVDAHPTGFADTDSLMVMSVSVDGVDYAVGVTGPEPTIRSWGARLGKAARAAQRDADVATGRVRPRAKLPKGWARQASPALPAEPKRMAPTPGITDKLDWGPGVLEGKDGAELRRRLEGGLGSVFEMRKDAIPDVLHHECLSLFLLPEADLSSVRTRARRMDPEKAAAAADLLARLQERGRVRPARGHVSSPPVFVRKSDGSYRFAIDYRALNAQIAPDLYPTPTPDTCIRRLARGARRSILDGKSQFWQIRMDDESAALTAVDFGAGLGLWEFLVAPFGILSVPAHLQRFMDRTFSDENHVPYADDLGVWHASEASVAGDILRVLEKAYREGYTFNGAKCRMGFESLTFLGFEVGPGRIRAPDDRVAALRAFPLPTTAKAITKWVNQVQYFSGTVPGFARLVGPLRLAARRGGPGKTVVLTAEEEAAFEATRQALLDRCDLAPLGAGDVYLVTDYAASAFGYMLLQGPEGSRSIIAVGSVATQGAQSRYSAVHGEAQALRVAMERLEPLGLRGRTIHWSTDNKPLLSVVQSTSAPTGRSDARLYRTAVELQKWDIVATFEAGESILADLWSRAGSPGKGGCGRVVTDFAASVNAILE
jgi:hypothetical protein